MFDLGQLFGPRVRLTPALFPVGKEFDGGIREEGLRVGLAEGVRCAHELRHFHLPDRGDALQDAEAFREDALVLENFNGLRADPIEEGGIRFDGLDRHVQSRGDLLGRDTAPDPVREATAILRKGRIFDFQDTGRLGKMVDLLAPMREASANIRSSLGGLESLGRLKMPGDAIGAMSSVTRLTDALRLSGSLPQLANKNWFSTIVPRLSPITAFVPPPIFVTPRVVFQPVPSILVRPAIGSVEALCEDLHTIGGSRLAARLRGAVVAYKNKGWDWQRHAFTSMRELIVALLNEFAPAPRAQAWGQFRALFTAPKRLRQLQAAYAFRDDEESLEMASEVYELLYDLSVATHGDPEHYSEVEAREIFSRARLFVWLLLHASSR